MNGYHKKKKKKLLFSRTFLLGTTTFTSETRSIVCAGGGFSFTVINNIGSSLWRNVVGRFPNDSVFTIIVCAGRSFTTTIFVVIIGSNTKAFMGRSSDDGVFIIVLIVFTSSSSSSSSINVIHHGASLFQVLDLIIELFAEDIDLLMNRESFQICLIELKLNRRSVTNLFTDRFMMILKNL